MSKKKDDRIEELIQGIRRMIPLPEVLCSLAEESGELTQAAIKYRRTIVPDNPTPVSKSEARAKLLEEFGDVLLCMAVLDICESSPESVMDGIAAKAERWYQRLRNGERREETE